ncbi:MAG: AbrB/MazE/SpoVT family DNA-binding domain-containing protein [Dehalococcoidia bacterium]
MKRVIRQLRNGQITIPKDLREAAGIEPGDMLSIDLVEGKLEMEAVKVTPKGSAWARDLYEMFAPIRKGMAGRGEKEINEAIGEALKQVRAARE